MKRYVYVITSEPGPVKVGIAGDVKQRLSALRTASAYPLMLFFAGEVEQPLAQALEQAVHHDLAECRMAGEWFNISAEDARQAVRNRAAIMGIQLVERDTPKRPMRQDEMTHSVLARFKDKEIVQALDEACLEQGGISRPAMIRAILERMLPPLPSKRA